MTVPYLDLAGAEAARRLGVTTSIISRAIRRPGPEKLNVGNNIPSYCQCERATRRASSKETAHAGKSTARSHGASLRTG
jgi:hypothetical protein